MTNKDIRLMCERLVAQSVGSNGPQTETAWCTIAPWSGQLHETSLTVASKLLILLQGLQHGDLFDDDSLLLLELLILCAAKNATL